MKKTKTKRKRMKTILVVYTYQPLTAKQREGMKKYSFNTADSVKIGDMIKSPDYDTPMQVIDILPKTWAFVNVKTGELSNERNSTASFAIRELKVATPKPNRDAQENVVRVEKLDVDED